MAGTLGTWFVEVSAKGVEATKASLASVTKAGEKAAYSLGQTLSGAARLGAGSLLALSTAGLAGTQEGNKLVYSFQMLGREIAAVALPAIRAAIEGMQNLTAWFRELTGKQQESLLKWAGLATGLTLIATGIGTIPGLILTAISATKLFNVSLSDIITKLRTLAIVAGTVLIATGIGAIKGAALLAAVAVSGLVSQVGLLSSKLKEVKALYPKDSHEDIDNDREKLLEEIKGTWFLMTRVGKQNEFNERMSMIVARRARLRGQGEEDNDRNSLSPVPGRFEAITSSYARLQTEVSRTDTTPKKQLDAQVAANEKLDQIAAATDATARKVGAILPA